MNYSLLPSLPSSLPPSLPPSPLPYPRSRSRRKKGIVVHGHGGKAQGKGATNQKIKLLLPSLPPPFPPSLPSSHFLPPRPLKTKEGCCCAWTRWKGARRECGRPWTGGGASAGLEGGREGGEEEREDEREQRREKEGEKEKVNDGGREGGQAHLPYRDFRRAGW